MGTAGRMASSRSKPKREITGNAGIKQLESEGVEALYEELRWVDAEAAGRVDGRNPRRVVRALEVALSRDVESPAVGDDEERPRRIPPDYDALVVGLTMERSALYERIDARIDAQMAAGWLDEVRGLRERGYGLAGSKRGTAALSGLGYDELMRHMDGEMVLEEAVQRIKYRTHRYARQQYAWFRLGDERIRWLEAPVGDAVYEGLVGDVWEWLGDGG